MKGIYSIKNKVNNKVYIGSTLQSFTTRFNKHMYDLANNIHHSSHLQKAYNKYGVESFEFSILEECTADNVVEREQHYLDITQSYKRELGYNILEKAYNSEGYRHTPESLLLIGKTSKETAGHPNTMNAMWEASRGSKRSEEHCKNISKAHSRVVIQLDLDGKYIKEWKSCAEATLSFNLKPNDTNIAACSRGRCKSYQGFMWVKKVDYDETLTYSYSPIINGIRR